MVFRLKQRIYILPSPNSRVENDVVLNGNKSKIIVTRLPRDTIPSVRAVKLRQRIIDNAFVLPNRGRLFGPKCPRNDRTTSAKGCCGSYDRSRRYPCPEITSKHFVESPTRQQHREGVSGDTKPFPGLDRSIMTRKVRQCESRLFLKFFYFFFIASVVQ